MSDTKIPAMPANPYSREAMQERYAALCKVRDERNAKAAPLQVKLDAANAKVIAAQAEAAALAKQIEDAWGNGDWITLKREIGVLATALSRAR